SAPGRAGIAVLRLSGPGAADVVRALCGAVPPPRRASLRRLTGVDGAVIDRGLVLWFAAPHSFTGEDVAEFHVHGGQAVLDGLFDAIGSVPGTRPAEPGEFTRRAVEAGKLDLTQAEGLIDLIDAQTEAQRRQALAQYDGASGGLYEDWRERLIRLLAWAEAEIDFSDEELPEGLRLGVLAQTAQVAAEIAAHLEDGRRGEMVRDGVFLTVIGPPNAGKSSLVNALARRDVAIVAETAGTTRDIVEVRLDIGGYAVIVADTAGLRETADAVESEGVRRALARAERSDLVLLLLDASAPRGGPDGAPAPDLVVWNKSDLAPPPAGGTGLSLRTGEGLDGLLLAIEDLVRARLDGAAEAPVVARRRHRHALQEALAALRRAAGAGQAELMAEDLRLAMRAIGRITGRVDVEDLLDIVFRDFCIGK
ncbi:MAG TPA: tRNA uridine-5-carboxymethylaminomethyl(34) synthesis GTPase MnmE, partial [Rhizomicrobium sp.]